MREKTESNIITTKASRGKGNKSKQLIKHCVYIYLQNETHMTQVPFNLLKNQTGGMLEKEKP